MKITLEMYGRKFTVEENNDDVDGRALQELFSRMLIVSGYSLSIIECPDGGHYEYVAEDEEVIKKRKEE